MTSATALSHKDLSHSSRAGGNNGNGSDTTPDRRYFGATTDDAAIFIEDTVDKTTARCISSSPSAIAILTPQRLPSPSHRLVDVTEYEADNLGLFSHPSCATENGGGGSSSVKRSRPSQPLHDVTNTVGVRLSFGKSPNPKVGRAGSYARGGSNSSGSLSESQSRQHQHYQQQSLRTSSRGETCDAKNTASAYSTHRRKEPSTPSPAVLEPMVPLTDLEAMERNRNRYQKMYEHQRMLYEEMADKHADTYQTLQEKIMEVVALSTRNEESKRFIRQLKREMAESKTRVMDIQNRALEEAREDRLAKSRYEALIDEHECKYDRLMEQHESKLAGMEGLVKDLTCLSRDRGDTGVHVSQLDGLLKAAYAKNTALFSDMLRQGRQLDLLHQSRTDLEMQLERERRSRRDAEAALAEERRRMMSETERFIDQIEDQQHSILNLRQMLIRTMEGRGDEVYRENSYPDSDDGADERGEGAYAEEDEGTDEVYKERRDDKDDVEDAEEEEDSLGGVGTPILTRTGAATALTQPQQPSKRRYRGAAADCGRRQSCGSAGRDDEEDSSKDDLQDVQGEGEGVHCQRSKYLAGKETERYLFYRDPQAHEQRQLISPVASSASSESSTSASLGSKMRSSVLGSGSNTASTDTASLPATGGLTSNAVVLQRRDIAAPPSCSSRLIPPTTTTPTSRTPFVQAEDEEAKEESRTVPPQTKLVRTRSAASRSNRSSSSSSSTNSTTRASAYVLRRRSQEDAATTASQEEDDEKEDWDVGATDVPCTVPLSTVNTSRRASMSSEGSSSGASGKTRKYTDTSSSSSSQPDKHQQESLNPPAARKRLDFATALALVSEKREMDRRTVAAAEKAKENSESNHNGTAAATSRSVPQKGSVAPSSRSFSKQKHSTRFSDAGGVSNTSTPALGVAKRKVTPAATTSIVTTSKKDIGEKDEDDEDDDDDVPRLAPLSVGVPQALSNGSRGKRAE